MAIRNWYLTLNFDSGIESVKFNYGSNEHVFATSGEEYTVGYEPDSAVYLTATMKEGYSLDTMVNDGGVTIGTVNNNVVTIPLVESGFNYTWIMSSKQSGVGSTMKFKHFYDAGLQGTGTIKFRHYSQTEPSSGVTLEAGTYQFIESPTFPANEIDVYFDGLMWTLTSTNTYGTQINFSEILIDPSNVIQIYATDESKAGITYGESEWSYGSTPFFTTDTAKLRTITLEADQQVSPEFYKWAITDGNLVKQGGVTGHTLTFTGVTVTVDGVAVTSPYTLTQNCTIVATANTANYEVVVTAGSIEHHTDVDGDTLSLADTDINITEASVGGTKMNNITINYTTGGGGGSN